MPIRLDDGPQLTALSHLPSANRRDCFSAGDRENSGRVARKNGMRWRRKLHYDLSEELGSSISLFWLSVGVSAPSFHRVSEGERNTAHSFPSFNCGIKRMCDKALHESHNLIFFISSISRPPYWGGGVHFFSQDLTLNCSFFTFHGCVLSIRSLNTDTMPQIIYCYLPPKPTSFNQGI